MNDKTYDDEFTHEQLLILAESTAPISVESDLKAKIKSNILNQISACPEGGNTIRKGSADWLALNDYISIKILHQDLNQRLQTSLWRLKPGAKIKGHKHNNDEECFVIEGSVNIDSHILFAGDYHVMNKGSVHADIVSKEGALLFLKHDMHESQVVLG